jgi:hypothetical protein
MESLAPLLGGGRGKPVSLKEKEKLGKCAFSIYYKKLRNQHFLLVWVLEAQIVTF